MEKIFYFGADIGGTFTKIAVIDKNCRIVAKAVISSRGFCDKRLFVGKLRAGLDKLLSQSGAKRGQIKAGGIGLPGPVDFDRGLVLSLTNIKGWDSFYIVNYFKKFFPFPFFAENDANCMALAESRLGAARGASFVLCLTLGTGVGGGLILNKEIYRGPFYSGGEVGHIPLDLKGPNCACGGFGCLEKYVGNRAIMKMARIEFARRISLEELSRLAKSGNPKAVKIWKRTGDLLGLAISGVVNVFNPEVVVIGGGIAEAGQSLLGPVRRKVRRHAMRFLKDKVKIKKATLGSDAGVLGAGLLAKERIGA